MKQLTHLKDNLYGIEIPADSIEIFIDDILVNKLRYWCNKGIRSIDLPEGNWKILGTASKDKISFDPSPYLDSHISESNNQRCFKDYEYVEKYPKSIGQYFINPKNSFRSLLNSKGYYYENPLQKPDFNDTSIDEYFEEDFDDDKADWQRRENKLLTGIILLIEKVK